MPLMRKSLVTVSSPALGDERPSVLPVVPEHGDNLHIPAKSDETDLCDILPDLNQTAYVWDIAKDQIAWESNATRVLGLPDEADITTSSAYHKLICPEHITRRLEMTLGIRSDEVENGVPYRVQYRFRPHGPRGANSFWIEDFGRWWPGDDGLAVHARGGVRVVSNQYVEAQRRLYGSDHDDLTGLLNRVRLMETLTISIKQAQEQCRSGVFMIASVNNLSSINETLGFEVGDEMIAAAGRVLRGDLRQGDTIGRYSSNKFGIILQDYAASEMGAVARRLIATVRQTGLLLKTCQLSGSISIGGVCFPKQVESASQALNCALHALQCARGNRGDTFVSHMPDKKRETKRMRSLAISDEIVSALRENRISVVAQPVICSSSGKPTHYECLARLYKTDGRAISPCEFMPVSEELGLSGMIDLRVLEIAADLLNKHPWLNLSINVSGLTTFDSSWMGELCGLFKNDRTLTKRLIIEITETALIEDIDQALTFIDTVRNSGAASRSMISGLAILRLRT